MFLFSVIIKGHDHATCSSIIHVFMMSLMLSLLTSRTTWVTKSCLIFVFPSHVAEIHGDVAFLSHQHPSKTPRDRSAARAKHGTRRGHWLKGSSTIACGDWWHIVFYLLQIQGEFDWICKKTKNNKRTVPGNGILHVTFDSALIPIAYSLYRSRGRRRVDRPRNDGRRHFLQAPGAFVLAQMPAVLDGTKNIWAQKYMEMCFGHCYLRSLIPEAVLHAACDSICVDNSFCCRGIFAAICHAYHVPDVQVAWYYLPRTCWRYLSIVFSCVIHNVI